MPSPQPLDTETDFQIRRLLPGPGRAPGRPPSWRRGPYGVGGLRFVAACAGVAVVVGTGVGCGSAHWLANGWLDPTQTGQFNQTKRNEIRKSISILEEPLGVQNAEEPTADDLVPRMEAMKINPGDAITISVFELQMQNMATVQQLRVGTSGYETIPTIGPVRVVGLTARELELEIKQRLREAEVLPDADVQVTILESRSMQCSVVGNAMHPGLYPLPFLGIRLLDVIAMAGGVPPTTEQIYVIQQPQQVGEPAQPTSGVAESSVGRRNSGLAPERRPFTLSDMSSGAAAGGMRQPQPQPPATGKAESQPEEPDEVQMPAGKIQPEWDEERGWVLREEGAPPTTGEAKSPTEPAAATTPAATGEAVPEEESRGLPPEELGPPTRIIGIPMKELMDGDPRYNVVIRPRDLINVPPGNVGEFFMMGNVARPGAYTLTGRRLTVKEAIASAGGFGPLAWPSRADLVRRLSEDEEQIIQLDLDAIFAGDAPDFYLKPSDVVNVGTTVPAYFFAVLRNSFRFTYGAGFVYDRNFGDSDTFDAKQELKAEHRAERAAKGLPAY